MRRWSYVHVATPRKTNRPATTFTTKYTSPSDNDVAVSSGSDRRPRCRRTAASIAVIASTNENSHAAGLRSRSEAMQPSSTSGTRVPTRAIPQMPLGRPSVQAAEVLAVPLGAVHVGLHAQVEVARLDGVLLDGCRDAQRHA